MDAGTGGMSPLRRRAQQLGFCPTSFRGGVQALSLSLARKKGRRFVSQVLGLVTSAPGCFVGVLPLLIYYVSLQLQVFRSSIV